MELTCPYFVVGVACSTFTSVIMSGSSPDASCAASAVASAFVMLPLICPGPVIWL